MNSLIITDRGNRRVVRWSRESGTVRGEILLDGIDCHSLALDNERYLYVSDDQKHEVRRYQLSREAGINSKQGTLIAGGNMWGSNLNELFVPTYIFFDGQQAVYVSDTWNHRVMKWNRGAQEGIVVAGGQGFGSALTQLARPRGLFVDSSGNVYVAEQENHRVTRWPREAKEGTVVVDGNGEGAKQFSYPRGLSFDRQRNLYVVDHWNHRVQRFSI
ncbi:unnamed protein product, partial [Rotaria sp. Silwood1]